MSCKMRHEVKHTQEASERVFMLPGVGRAFDMCARGG